MRTVETNVARILVIRRRYVGDLILLEPFLRNLREARPGARITVVVDQGYEDVLRGCASLDEIAVLPVRGGLLARLRGWWQLLGQVRRSDLAFDFSRNEQSALLLALSGAPRRVSHEITDDAAVRRRRWSDRLRRRLTSTDLVRLTRAEQVAMHAVDYENLLLHAVGIEAPHRRPSLRVAEEARERARELAERARGDGRDRPLVLVHPGGRGESKQWPVERFAAVADALEAEPGAAVVFVAGPGEGHLARTFRAARRCGGGLVLDEVPALADLYALLAECALFVGNDSGPAHMAEAVGTPTLTLFGATRVAVWRPLGERDVALQPDLPCREACLRPAACGDGKPRWCVQRIEEGEVIAAARRMLADAARGPGGRSGSGVVAEVVE